MNYRIKNEQGGWVAGQPEHGQPYQYDNGFGSWATVASYDAGPSVATKIRAERDKRIQDTLWMYERLAREQRLGLPLTYTLEQLDTHVQALADITEQEGFPENIMWPTLSL